MKNLKLFTLSAVVLLFLSNTANANSALLSSDDFVGVSFWIISISLAATTGFLVIERENVKPKWKLFQFIVKIYFNRKVK